MAYWLILSAEDLRRDSLGLLLVWRCCEFIDFLTIVEFYNDTASRDFRKGWVFIASMFSGRYLRRRSTELEGLNSAASVC